LPREALARRIFHKERPLEIDIDDLVPGRFLRGFDGGKIPAAGIVDEDIQAAEAGNRRFDDSAAALRGSKLSGHPDHSLRSANRICGIIDACSR
jgi:hypothetical protein